MHLIWSNKTKPQLFGNRNVVYVMKRREKRITHRIPSPQWAWWWQYHAVGMLQCIWNGEISSWRKESGKNKTIGRFCKITLSSQQQNCVYLSIWLKASVTCGEKLHWECQSEHYWLACTKPWLVSHRKSVEWTEDQCRDHYTFKSERVERFAKEEWTGIFKKFWSWYSFGLVSFSFRAESKII